MTPEEIVADLLYQHRYRFQAIACAARDWTYNGNNDFHEHQAMLIVAALRSAGFLDEGRRLR